MNYFSICLVRRLLKKSKQQQNVIFKKLLFTLLAIDLRKFAKILKDSSYFVHVVLPVKTTLFEKQYKFDIKTSTKQQWTPDSSTETITNSKGMAQEI